ncbi:MAG TPA: CDP-glycerol glycerophosphotransferase family protein [Solidesulfovibrio magneticus]|nr:CDP-glycerol glycerophosphotransferase family protein [Solidesulfovibrio magneticus]
MSSISVVVAVYNAQPWLARFAASLQAQTFKDFEVLMVDDASSDDSVGVIGAIASADPRFKLVALPENRGAGAARNIGIRQAVGDTLCFADPDDLLPARSLEARYAAYKTHKTIVRGCHDEIFADGTVIHHEKRPAGVPEVCQPLEESWRVGVGPFCSAHWTWLMPTGLLRRNGIGHGEGMRTAEDILLLARLFFHVKRLAWINDVVYYWVKRENSLSTTAYTAEHYADYFRCCDEFYTQAKKHGKIRLADRFFDDYLTVYPAHLLKQVGDGKSGEEDVREVIKHMARVAESHGAIPRCLEDIKRNPLRNVGLQRLMRILGGKNPSAIWRLAESQDFLARLSREAEYAAVRARGWSQEVLVDKFDRDQGLLRARYLFCGQPPQETVFWGDAAVKPAYAKNRKVHDGDGFTVSERILWLPLPPDDDIRLGLAVAGQKTSIDHLGRDIRAAFAPTPLSDAGFPPQARALRRLAASAAIQAKFKGAWMFIDKDTEADDNAEHLYRWVLRHHPEINAWFVLAEDSHDWARLAAEGFRLVPHGGLEHGALFLTCDKLISSQMDRYIFAPLEEQHYRDFPRPKFVCLPHGVTKDDVSQWFNSIPFDLFITATRPETASLIEDGTPYVMTAKEVRLGGFPRYDKWLEPGGQPDNVLFVMPTWRADLVGAWDGKGQRRERNPRFGQSLYATMWREFFVDPRIEGLLAAHGWRAVFFAHPGFEDYLDAFAFPAYVEARSKRHGSIVEVMRTSKAMVTDFSSVAFDMAYMRRPILYYQYEPKAAFTRSQRWVSGYIDYETMGFGPVCRTMDEVAAALEQAVLADGVMPEPYASRAEATFAFHDAQCCRRAYEFIVADGQPYAGR